MKRYFDCQCGKKNIDSMDRSASDKTHNVDRCKECHSKYHGEQVVSHAKEKARQYEERNKAQAEERRAKAEQLARGLDEKLSIAPRVKTSAESKVKSKARRDKIEFDLELKHINEEYA